MSTSPSSAMSSLGRKDAGGGGSPPDGAAASVRAAAEALWVCASCEEAREWLRILSDALEDTGPPHSATYDPADVFLAVQGVELRLRPRSPAATDANVEEKARLLREDTLVTVATLCRVGVGPAWQHQRLAEGWRSQSPRERRLQDAPTVRRGSRQQRMSSDQKKAPEPPMEDRQEPLLPWRFPHIPEVLPAAMIRFAAAMVAHCGDDAPLTSMFLAQAEIFSALLCYLSTEKVENEKASALRSTFPHCGPQCVAWDVPDVQPQLRQFLTSWLKVCCSSGCDWALRRRLLRHARDLVSCISRDRVASGSAAEGANDEAISGGIATLLQISVDAIDAVLSSPDESYDDTSLSSSENSLSIVAACGAEAMSVLAQLSARQLIPVDAASGVAGACRALHTQATSIILQIEFAHCTDESCPCYFHDRDLISNEISDFLGSVEDLWYFMVTQERTAVMYLDILTDMVALSDCKTAGESMNFKTLQENWSFNRTMICRQAGKATDILSSAFWCSEAASTHVSFLRIFWLPFLSKILGILKRLGRRLEFIEDTAITSEVGLLAAHLAIALSRAMAHEQMTESTIKLSETEWEAIIHNFDEGIIVWLSWSRNQNEVVFDAIELLLAHLCKCLDFWSDCMDIPFIELNSQKALYLVLLKEIVPLVSANLAQEIGLLVVKCWLKFGLFPFRVENFCTTASEVLNEAFRRNIQGDYFHSPCVRLQALKILTKDDFIFNNQGEVVAQDKLPSLLCLIQHNREQYVHLVGYIIPVLKEVFESTELKETVESTAGKSIASSMKHATSQYSSYHQMAKELATHFEHSSQLTEYGDLACYCIQLTGRIFRAASGHTDHRQFCINFLRMIAVNRCSNTSDISVCFSIRLAAVLELEKCVSAAFTSLLHAHASVPSLVESLAIIFDKYLEDLTDPVNEMIQSQSTIIAIAALCPLTRIRVAIDNHVVFMQDQRRSSSPYCILCWCYEMAAFIHRFSVVEASGTSTLEFTHDVVSSSSQIKTMFSLGRIIVSAVSFLQCRVTEIRKFHHMALSFSLQCVRIHCLDILRRFFVTSVAYRMDNEIICAIFEADASATDCDFAEIQASCLALTQYAGNVFLMGMQNASENATSDEEINHFDLLLGLVLALFEADLPPKRKIGCHAVCALLSILAKDEGKNFFARSRLERIFSSLRNVLLKASGHVPQTIKERLATEEVFAVIFDMLAINPSSRLPVDIHLLCLNTFFQLAESFLWTSEKFCNIIGLHCVAKMLDLMDIDELQTARELLMSTKSNHICVQAVLGLIDSQASRFHSADQRLISDTDDCEKPIYNALMTQEELLKQFVWDSNDQRCRVAWLMRDCCIFTCRVGSPATRYADSMEMVWRSQTERKCSIIQIPGRGCIRNPDSLLDATILHRQGGTSDENTNRTSLDARILDDMATIRARFDKLMAASDHEQPPTPNNSVKNVCSRFDTFFGALKYFDEGNNHHEEEKLPEPEVDVFELWIDQSLHTLSISEHNLVMEAITDFLSSSGFSGEKKDVLDKSVHDLRYDEKLDRAIGVLDRSPIMNTHKIALLYDGMTETRALAMDVGDGLLSTKNGSPAFHRLANGLGKLVPTKSLKDFSGGLDTSSEQIDGEFAYLWTNVDETRSVVASTSIVFHVVSLMPLSAHGNVVHRKRHIGNDFVIICFSDYGCDALAQYDLSGGELIGGAFGLVGIFVTSLRPGMYRVNVRVRNNTPDMFLNQCLSGFIGDYTVSEKTGPSFIRNMAMRADLACRAKTGSPDALPNFVHRKQILSDLTRHFCA